MVQLSSNTHLILQQMCGEGGGGVCTPVAAQMTVLMCVSLCTTRHAGKMQD
jgi:hypothetical protein